MGEERSCVLNRAALIALSVYCEREDYSSVTYTTALPDSAACGWSWGFTLWSSPQQRHQQQEEAARVCSKCKGDAEELWWTWAVVECVGMAVVVDGGNEFGQAERWKGGQKDDGITLPKQCMLLICSMGMMLLL